MHSRRALAEMIGSDFDEVAQLYDQIQAPLSDSISMRLVELANVSSAKNVLDIGTGTGSAAISATQAVGKRGEVTGIDVSEGMLAIARKKAMVRGLTNIHFERMEASYLEFATGSFDAVISNLGMPIYLLRNCVSEASRVLKGGGTLCFSEYNRSSPAWTALSNVLGRYAVQRATPALRTRREARKQMSTMASAFPLSSFTNILGSVGLVKVRTSERTFGMTQVPSRLYLRYLVRREELEYAAMPEVSKKRFQGEMLKRLEAIRTRNAGKLTRKVRFWLAEKPG